MSQSNDDLDTSPRRIRIAKTVLVLSLTLPLAIAALSVYMAFGGKPLGRAAREQRFYSEGCVTQGELWFLASDDPFSIPTQFRVKRLNLKTGVEQDTGLSFFGGRGQPKWINGEFYVFGFQTIHKLINNSLEHIATKPQTAVIFKPFLYDGKPTTAVRDPEGGYRLIHHSEDRWTVGRKILLPGLGRVWSEKDDNGRHTLVPITTKVGTAGQPSEKSFDLEVVNDGDQLHLLYTIGDGFRAFRNGFEFESDGSDEIASALGPENSMHEVSGWEYVPANDHNSPSFHIVCDKNGPFFFYGWPPSFLIRRDASGQFALQPELRVDMSEPFMAVSLVANPDDPSAYLVSSDSWFNSVEIHEISGASFDPRSVKLPGAKIEYQNRRRWLIDGFIGAWLVHIAISIAGLYWVRRSQRTFHYQFGMQQAILASPLRRFLAWVIDLSWIIFLMVFAHTRIITMLYPFGASESERRFAFLRFEDCLMKHDFAQAFQWCPGVAEALLIAAPSHEALMYWVALAITMFVALVVTEWRFGWTPGKRLMGIRVLKSSLRPCGAFLILLRDVLYWIDIPFLLIPLPGAISMILSPSWQRVGDRLADTVVVINNSIEDL